MASPRLQAALLGLVLALGLGLAPAVAASIPDTQGIADDLRFRLSEASPELDVSEPVRVAGDGASLAKTRVRGFRLFDPESRLGWNGVSRGNAAGYGFSLWGSRVGSRQRWDWRGQLVSVEVKATWPDADGDGEPDASPYAGHRVRYDYDAQGRLTRRLHEGADDGTGVRGFIEDRRFVWEGDRLAVEAAYGGYDTAGDPTNLRWRRTYVPGPTGLDDPPQVVVEIFQPGSPYSGEARTYTYLRDELGTVVGLVAEDEGTDPNHPPVPVRYRYTPYGEVHVESGPELLRARFDADATEVTTTGGTVTQTIAEPALSAAGAMVLDWSLRLDAATLPTGVVVEELLAGTGWTPINPARLALGEAPASDGTTTNTDDPRLRVLLTDGWDRGKSYRVRLTTALRDRLGRPLAEAENLEWSVPAPQPGSESTPPPVIYDQRFPTPYASAPAAANSAGGRFPAGQSRLFQGLWTDPVTGAGYARARWYDARNGVFLTEDPMGVIDSPNLYAFVGHHPNLGVDPLGLCEGDLTARLFGIGCTEGQDDAGVFGEGALGIGEGLLGLVEDTVVGAWEASKLIVQEGPIDAAKIMAQGLKQSIQQAPQRTLAWLEMMNNATPEEAAREFGRGVGRAVGAVASGGGAAAGGAKLASRAGRGSAGDLPLPASSGSALVRYDPDFAAQQLRGFGATVYDADVAAAVLRSSEPTVGRPGGLAWLSPAERAMQARTRTDLALDSGLAPSITRAANEGGDVYATMVPLKGLDLRSPTPDDGVSIHFLEDAGHTAIRGEGFYILNKDVWERVTPARPLPPRSMVMRFIPGKGWTPMRSY